MKWQNLPPYILYPLLIPHIIKLCFKYRTTPAVITKSNPVFPYGGLPFTSKKMMFSHFTHVLPYCFIKTKMDFYHKKKIAKKFIEQYGLPVIAKPDKGHRGVDVRLLKSKEDVYSLLKLQKWDYLLQEYCGYDNEFGIFYVRHPSRKTGEIISITQKIIPILKGDGQRSVRELIDESNIENKKAIVKILQNKLSVILPEGQKIKTLVTASHCQGAMFKEAMHLLTPALLNKTREILDHVKGFHFGRLDVKSKSIKDFQNGNYDILEVNGATSELIHVYDNAFSFKNGLEDLKKQWSILFEISNCNRNKIGQMSFINFIKKYVEFFIETKKVTGRLW